MTIIDKIKKQSRINVDEVIETLKKQLKIENDDVIEQLYYSLYATLQIILNTTNRLCIIEDMYTLWVDMTKDYWHLNGYNATNNSSDDTEQEKQTTDEDLKVKSIERGDTKIDFRESNNETTINGVTYKTGTIEYDEDVLINRYQKRLYKFRLLGKKRRW